MVENRIEYYQTRRDELIEFMPDGIRRVLEVGCGAGLTGRALKEKKGATFVAGVEINAAAAEEAKGNVDKVVSGDVEKLELPFEKGYFDCIIYADVLEHLVDPWSVLAKHREFLSKDGIVVASIPNIAHYRIIQMLGRKEWNYASRGILDRTHLRFFALRSIKSMFNDAEFDIIKIERRLAGSKVKKVLNKIFFGAFKDYLTEQYFVIAGKKV